MYVDQESSSWWFCKLYFCFSASWLCRTERLSSPTYNPSPQKNANPDSWIEREPIVWKKKSFQSFKAKVSELSGLSRQCLRPIPTGGLN